MEETLRVCWEQMDTTYISILGHYLGLRNEFLQETFKYWKSTHVNKWL